MIVDTSIYVGSQNTNSAIETPKTYNFTIDGGNYSNTAGTVHLIELFSNESYDFGRSITANIKIKKGTFTSNQDLLWVPAADKDITMNFTFDTLTYYNSNCCYLGQNRFGSIKIEEVVPNDSKIYYWGETSTTERAEQELTDRTKFVANLSTIRSGSAYIKIIKAGTVTQTVDTIDTIAFYMSDKATDIVKLTSDITFSGRDLIFYIYKDKTLDLNGYSIISENNSNYEIRLWYYKDASVKIIDSSNSGKSKIKLTYSGASTTYAFRNTIRNTITGSDVNTADLSIDGVDFESANDYSFLITTSNSQKLGNLSIKNSNITGFYQIFDNGGLASVKLTDVTKKSIESAKSTYLSNTSDLTVADIIDEDSVIEYYTAGIGKVTAEKTTKLSEINSYWGPITITYSNGFNVENVNLTETYNATPTEKEITIKNRGTSDLQVKNVTVDSENFEIIGDTQPTISAGEADSTSFTIKAKEGLDAGDYSATITVTDINDETYTAKVTLKVNPKQLTAHSVTMANWRYCEDEASNPVVTGLDGLTTDDYEITYAKKDSEEFSTTKPTKVGEYTVKLHVTNKNYSAEDVTNTFSIEKNDVAVIIQSTDGKFVYDGTEHTAPGYAVYYKAVPSLLVGGGVLKNGDTVTAEVTGKVKDVKDTASENNTIGNAKIVNANNEDVTEFYSNIQLKAGKLTVTKKDSKIKVTSEGATRVYNGEALTNDRYTASATGVDADIVKVTMTGKQTYVGSSDNTFTVKVMRGDEDVTDNYTFDTHSYGILQVTPADQPLGEIADQYVRINGSIEIRDLELLVPNAKGNVNFDIKSGTALTYDNDNREYKAGTNTGDVVMTVTASAFDDNGDGVYDWNETKKDFTIHVVAKESVTFSGLVDNEEFEYDGNSKTPSGAILVTDNKVEVSSLEISYTGTGSTVYNGGNVAPKNVGTYKVVYKVPDSNANYMGSVTYNFTIKKAELEKVSLAQNTFEYTGEEIKTTLNNYDNEVEEVSGTIKATNADDYTITISLKDKDNYEWKDNSTNDLTLSWSITKAKPTYNVPTGLVSEKGKKLSDVTLPTGFSWNTSETELEAGTRTYKATYTPEDIINYETVSDIDIEIRVKDLFKVTTSVNGGNGSITESMENVLEDEKVSIEFTPNSGYVISKVLVNGEEKTSEVADDKIEIIVTRDINVEVTYKKKYTGGGGGGSATVTYKITVTDPENAEITPNGTVKVEKGEDQTFKIKANEGYEIEDVLVDGKSVGAVSEYTFENVKAAHTLEAKAKKVEIVPEEDEEVYKDVKKNDWYFNSVKYITDKKIMNGLGNNEFGPSLSTTRGMIATILYRLEGSPKATSSTFIDVEDTAYYAAPIAWAEANGIVNGYGEGKFGPNDIITREQLVAIMYRYSNYKKYDTSVGEDTNILDYDDAIEISSYAIPAIQWACGESIVTGTSQTTIEPKGDATRAQVATIIMRYCEKYEN